MSTARNPPQDDRPLDEGARASLLRTLKKLRAEPAPKEPISLGCPAALLALVALIALPFVARSWDLELRTSLLAAAGLTVIFLGGAVASVFRGAFYRGEVAGSAERAIETLEAHYPDGPPALLNEAALRLLLDAYVSTGPTTVETFDAREVAARLGPALPHVLEVERFLLERKEIYPVFTIRA